MPQNDKIQLFEDKRIRTAWDEEKEEWYFSVVDVVAVLTDQPDARHASTYWAVLKKRLNNEGAGQLLTNCKQLKMTASDGRKRLTDVADTEQLLRIIQSIPSPKAEPFKLWLAQVGRERIEETIDPELTIERALETYLKKGYRQLTRANTPDSASFRRFLPFSPWRAPASLQRNVARQHRRYMPTQPACASKAKNHSKIHRWQVRAVLPEQKCVQTRKGPQRILAVLSRGLTQYGRISARQNRACPCQLMVHTRMDQPAAASYPSPQRTNGRVGYPRRAERRGVRNTYRRDLPCMVGDVHTAVQEP